MSDLCCSLELLAGSELRRITLPRTRVNKGLLGTYAIWCICQNQADLRSTTMRVELLYFEGCPSYLKAEETLRGVLTREDAEIELVAVNTDEEARRLRFPGSPTIRIDGE